MDSAIGEGAQQALHVVADFLLVPTIVMLFALLAYAVYTIGSLVVEVAVERRHYRVALPRLIERLDHADRPQLDSVIEASGLLASQRAKLVELVSYMDLPEDALTEVAKRLLADERERYEKALGWTEAATKVAPMLGLMGTLIPLGPGIMALSSGNLDALSSALMMAFDTTVAGLSVAVVCYLVTRVRKRWYRGYLVSMEGAMNTILEKAEACRG